MNDPMDDYDDVQGNGPQIQYNRNPSFEDGDPDDLWGNWESSMADGFEGDGGTMLVFPGPDPEQYPNAYDKETWDSPKKVAIRDEEWFSYAMTWSAKRKVDYLQGIRRPRWATGIFYKWWCRRVLKQSIKDLLDKTKYRRGSDR